MAIERIRGNKDCDSPAMRWLIARTMHEARRILRDRGVIRSELEIEYHEAKRGVFTV